jgi:hypothetical protein
VAPFSLCACVYMHIPTACEAVSVPRVSPGLSGSLGTTRRGQLLICPPPEVPFPEPSSLPQRKDRRKKRLTGLCVGREMVAFFFFKKTLSLCLTVYLTSQQQHHKTPV